MSEPAQKCENNSICKQSRYTLKLINAFKMDYSCCLDLRGYLDFRDFLQKSFITSTTGEFKTAGELLQLFQYMDNRSLVSEHYMNAKASYPLVPILIIITHLEQLYALA